MSGFLLESRLVAALTLLYRTSRQAEVYPEYEIGDGRAVDVAVFPTDGSTPELIEVRNITPQTSSRLADAVSQIKYLGSRFTEKNNRPAQLTVFAPGILAPDRLEHLQSSGVYFKNTEWLLSEARRVGVESEIQNILDPKPLESRSEGADLAQRISKLRTGQPTWSEYQNLCADVFDFLFSPPLKKGIRESSNVDGVNRRDIIMPNYSIDGFWAYLRDKYWADYIVIDAKNYTNPVSKTQALQLANYLSTHGPGRFGILTTRKGANRSSKITCREQWILHNKLILVLDDDDLIQMLTSKDAGGDPAELIQQKIEDFRLGI